MEIKKALKALEEAQESPIDEIEIPTKIINTNQIQIASTESDNPIDIEKTSDQANNVQNNTPEFSNDEEEDDDEEEEQDENDEDENDEERELDEQDENDEGDDEEEERELEEQDEINRTSRMQKEVRISKSNDLTPELMKKKDLPDPIDMEVVSADIKKKNEKTDDDDDQSVNCSLCAIPFNNQEMFEDHMKQIHGKQNKTFTCQLCKEIFTNDRILQAHFSSSHQIKTFMCGICSQMFLVEESYKNHKCGSQKIDFLKRKKIVSDEGNSMANKENSRPNGPKSIGFGKSSIEEPEEIGVGKFTCRLCDKKFALSKKLTSHFLDKHGIDIFDCNYCDKIFLSKELLENHAKSHKSSKTPAPKPLVRNMLPSTIQLTKIHNVKKIQCNICKQNFFTKQELQIHKDIIHNTSLSTQKNEIKLESPPGSRSKKSVQKVSSNKLSSGDSEMTDLDLDLKIINIEIGLGQTIHVIFYKGKKYITSAEASGLIPRFKGRDVLQKMLKLHKMAEIIPFVAKKEACKELFEECIIEGVTGIENDFGEIAKEVNLYELGCLPKIFDQFIPEANPELIQMYLKIKNFM